jgi:predicted 3-demethylubiquinone-9 3-methyltransferase (glyoxalase superfamily)
MPKITPFLWFDKDAEDAANFYVSVFPNSKINRISRYPSDTPQASAEAGRVMTVEFELDGNAFTALNGGPEFKFSVATSFVIDCDGQDEVDHYWDALTADGYASQCGWLSDKYGLSWQVTPRQLIEMTTSPDREAAARAFQAMMPMQKIDIAKIQAAYEGR